MKRLRCEYCGEKFDGKLRRCPHCGGLNKLACQYEINEARETALDRAADGAEAGAAAQPKQGVVKPKTIEELKLFAAEHDLPLRDMRVHLGEDYSGPKAYGIYRAEDGSFVVYKNKADGSRSVRYQGPDEAFAVNELFLKMKERIARQPARQAARLSRGPRGGGGPVSAPRPWREVVKRNFWKYLLILALCTAIWLLAARIVKNARRPDPGYYRYGGNYYYYHNDYWYRYDGGWLPVSIDDSEDLARDFDEYYQSDRFYAGYGVEDFADSFYYKYNGYDDGYDNGYDYDYDGNGGNNDYDYGGYDWNDDNDDWNNDDWNNDNDDWNNDDWNDDNDDWDDDDWDWDDDWGWDDDDDWDDDWGDDWDSDW